MRRRVLHQSGATRSRVGENDEARAWVGSARGAPPEADVLSFAGRDPVLERILQLLRAADPPTRVLCLEAITRLVDRATRDSGARTAGE